MFYSQGLNLTFKKMPEFGSFQNATNDGNFQIYRLVCNACIFSVNYVRSQHVRRDPIKRCSLEERRQGFEPFPLSLDAFGPKTRLSVLQVAFDRLGEAKPSEMMRPSIELSPFGLGDQFISLPLCLPPVGGAQAQAESLPVYRKIHVPSLSSLEYPFPEDRHKHTPPIQRKRNSRAKRAKPLIFHTPLRCRAKNEQDRARRLFALGSLPIARYFGNPFAAVRFELVRYCKIGIPQARPVREQVSLISAETNELCGVYKYATRSSGFRSLGYSSRNLFLTFWTLRRPAPVMLTISVVVALGFS